MASAVIKGVNHRTTPTKTAMMDHDALTEAVRSALPSQEGRAGRDLWFIGDLDGTERRAMEWARALTRLHAEHDIGNAPLWIPAASFGSTGAASGAIALCMAARAFERGHAPARQCSVWMCSEAGARGAVLVRAVTN